ncbi:hypothetical protein DRV85_11250 [Rhodosalinus halophilus]|uniref:histidine kinase n=2 Tax=Rhodosalinus halophilus TaxID=2259333 RepID=A0A365U981_9RHOB|nr:hypothetical protein DRV85_11250 [Rhodosalinus halophilus]
MNPGERTSSLDVERESRQTAANGTDRKRPRSLLTIVAGILTLALLPVGIIAVLQTTRAMQVADATYRADRLAEAVRIATPEREAILSALGLASGLADALAVLEPGSEDCMRLLQQSAETQPRMSFIGFVEPGGISRCNSTGGMVELEPTVQADALFANPRTGLSFDASGEVTKAPVIIVSQPVRASDGALRGFLSLSFPARMLEEARDRLGFGPEVQLVTFRANGDILTASTDGALVEDILPDFLSLSELVGGGSQSFAAMNRAGEARQFAIVPIAPGQAYALASWPARGPLPGQTLLFLSSLSFPVAMWLVSLAVAMLSMQRLVLRPIGALRRAMRSFADRRQIPISPTLHDSASELRDIEGTFHRMAETITRDEADLENKVYEREVLLREVHHRVKNNLQLMSSIMNMQARRATSPEVRAAIRDLQDRLASLATVHGKLYQSPDMARVRADTLIDDVARQLAALGSSARTPLRLDFDLEPVTMEPDQAAPLALLTAEAVTNALKYVEPDEEGACWLRIRLTRDEAAEDGAIELTIENSIAPGAQTEGASGLGSLLIRAFASQLEASLRQTVSDGRYAVIVRFAPAPRQGRNA